jgi:hypothetical protein
VPLEELADLFHHMSGVPLSAEELGPTAVAWSDSDDEADLEHVCAHAAQRINDYSDLLSMAAGRESATQEKTPARRAPT